MPTCIHCGVKIDLSVSDFSPSEGMRKAKPGTRPASDWDNVCAPCNYIKGLQGGPAANTKE